MPVEQKKRYTYSVTHIPSPNYTVYYFFLKHATNITINCETNSTTRIYVTPFAVITNKSCAINTEPSTFIKNAVPYTKDFKNISNFTYTPCDLNLDYFNDLIKHDLASKSSDSQENFTQILLEATIEKQNTTGNVEPLRNKNLENNKLYSLTLAFAIIIITLIIIIIILLFSLNKLNQSKQILQTTQQL